MKKKVINFNDGQVKVELNSEVRYSIDFERKQTLLIINELPAQIKKPLQLNDYHTNQRNGK